MRLSIDTGTGDSMMKAVRTIIAAGVFVAHGMAVVMPLHAQTEAASVRVMTYNLHRGGVVILRQPLSQTSKA